jgi:hypothetical protein
VELAKWLENFQVSPQSETEILSTDFNLSSFKLWSKMASKCPGFSTNGSCHLIHGM